MMTDYQKIRDAIEQSLNQKKSSFIIYPYGEYGVLAKRILNDSFGIVEDYVVDNRLSQYNSSIRNLDFLRNWTAVSIPFCLLVLIRIYMTRRYNL